MNSNRLVLVCLVLLTIFAGVIALRPAISPEPVRAQDYARGCGLQFEPGVTTLRAPSGETQVLGKVAYDTCNGKIWGFPTGTNAPYPIDNVSTTAPVSKPIYLGKFEVNATQK